MKARSFFQHFLFVIALILIFILIFNFLYIATTYSKESCLKSSSSYDLDYVASENSPYNNSWNQNVSFYNLRHNNMMTNVYNATYNFEDETVGTSSTDIDFIDSTTGEDVHHTVEIASNETHSTVIECWKDYTGSLAFTHDYVSSYGTVEYWLGTGSQSISDQSFYLTFRNSGTDLFGFREYTDDWYTYDDTTYHMITELENSVVASRWYHIRIDYESTLGGYLGLDQYTFNVTLNGFNWGNFDYVNDDTIDNIKFFTGSGNVEYNSYLDAVGFSEDGYEIGNNSIPIIIETDSAFYSIDKCEFQFDDSYEACQPLISNDFMNWEEEGGTYDNQYDNEEVPSKPYYTGEGGDYISGTEGSNTGLYNDTIRLHGGDINITYGLHFIENTASDGTFTLFVDSLYGTEIVELVIAYVNDDKCVVKYDNGAGYTNLFYIWGCSYPDSYYEFNAYLNDSEVRLIYYLNGTYNSSYSFDFIEDYECGVDSIELYCYENTGGSDTIEARIEYIGVYQFNISQIYDVGYIAYYFGNLWAGDNMNILDFNSYDYVKVAGMKSMKAWDNTSDESISALIRDFDNVPFVENVYGDTLVVFNSSLICILNYSVRYDLLNFTIKGIKITLGSDIFNPDYTFINVDDDDSYFYIIGDVIYWTMTIDQNSNAEYMTMDINIDNVPSVNRSMNFHGYWNGIGEATFQVNYTDTEFNFFPFQIGFHSVNTILPQDKVIDRFLITPTDANDDGLTGSTITGYFTDMTLLFYPDIDLTITTTALLTALVPLIVIVVPTLAIESVYGKKIIKPLFLLFSVICFVTTLIPTWLFFVIVFAIGLGFIMDRKGDML